MDKTERQIMYVKVTQGVGMGGDFLLKVRSDEISSGTAVLPWDSDKQDGNLLGDNSPAQALWDELDMGGEWWRLAHVLEIDTEQFVVANAGKDKDGNYERGPERLLVKYAWWWHGDGGAEVVITTRNIFILGENGQTIDKVR